MDRLFRIDFYPQDWIIDTSRLSLEERGLYIQIVCLIYSNRGEIDNNPAWIAGASGCSTCKATALIRRLAELGFVQLNGSKITQKRCENELKTKREHLENSAKGGRKTYEKAAQSKQIKDIASSGVDNSLGAPYPTPTATAREARASQPPCPPGGGGEAGEKMPPVPPKETPHVKRHKPQLLLLPDDWKPHDNHRAKCRTLGLDAEALADQFRNYHTARATRFASWDAAFFAWIGNATRFGGAGTAGRTAGRPEPRDITGAALRVAARYQTEVP